MVSASPRASSASHYRRAICDVAATLGFSAPTADETPLARALAARLMGHEVASLNTVRSILAIQPASTLVFREAGDISGLVATLLLKSCAEPDLVSGRFDGLAPDDEALGRADEPVSFYYVWGIAGATKTASSAVMALSRRLRYGALADLTAYAVAATPAGRHVGVTQLGFRPVRRPDDDLLVSAAIAERRAA